MSHKSTIIQAKNRIKGEFAMTSTYQISSPLLGLSPVTVTEETAKDLMAAIGNSGTEAESAETEKHHSKKREGVSSEVFTYTVEEARMMLDYFKQHEQWIHYLVFVLGLNLARRNGDIRSLTWANFFDPKTGKYRNNLVIKEQKTGKFTSPHINSAVKEAISLYCEKTGCDPSHNNYSDPILLQHTGNYVGRVMGYSGCLKGIKRAAAALGIEHNVGTHSTRKTFGETSRMLHPNDQNSMEILQSLYNHSSTKITNRYIGLEKKHVDRYYDDIGEFVTDYIVGGKQFEDVAQKPVVSLDVNDLRSIISLAYNAGIENAGKTDPSIHIDTINEILSMIDAAQK